MKSVTIAQNYTHFSKHEQRHNPNHVSALANKYLVWDIVSARRAIKCASTRPSNTLGLYPPHYLPDKATEKPSSTKHLRNFSTLRIVTPYVAAISLLDNACSSHANKIKARTRTLIFSDNIM